MGEFVAIDFSLSSGGGEGRGLLKKEKNYILVP